MAEKDNDLICKAMPDSFDIYISGDIEESSLEKFRKDINEKLEEIEKIISEQVQVMLALGMSQDECKVRVPAFNIYLNTYGGCVYPGLGICDMIEELTRSYDVNIICSGYIMSMGIPIMLSGTKRIAHKNTTFMVHEISSFGWGKLTQIKEDVKETERLNDILKSMIIEKSKITKKEINDWYEKKKDMFMSADEAIKYGLIDEII